MAPEPTYRFELAKSGRAGCRNTACKNQEIKIGKGEPRMGTLVILPDGTATWHWKHWGCVTPLQIKNIQDMVEGLDLETDLDVLDGWDEIDEEFQEKIKQAIRDGHVSDEDWRGSPELNRPGMRGINRIRTPKKKDIKNEDGDVDEPAESPTSKKKKKANSKKRKAEADLSEEEQPAPEPKKTAPRKKTKLEPEISDEAEEVAPKKATKARGKKAVKEEEEENDVSAPKKKAKPRRKAAGKVKKEEDSEDEIIAPPKKRTSRTKKQEALAEDPDAAAPPPKPKRGRAKKFKPEPDEVETEADVNGEAAVEADVESLGKENIKMEDIEQAAEPTEAQMEAPETRTRTKSARKQAAGGDAESFVLAPTKAARTRKVKQELSPSPEVNGLGSETEPQVENDASAPGDTEGPTVEPEFPVIANTDGTADMDTDVKLQTKAKRGRNLQKNEPIATIETKSTATSTRAHRGTKTSKVKMEEAADPLAETSEKAKKEVFAARGKTRGRIAKKAQA